MNRKLAAALALLSAVALTVAMGFRLFQALLLVEALLAPDAPGRLGSLCGEPRLEVVQLSDRYGEFPAQVHLPQGRRKHRAAVLSVPLAYELADNPGVVGMARALARAGTVVLVPAPAVELEALLGARDQAVLEASLDYLHGHGSVDPRRVGLIGVSYGSGPVLQLAASPEWRDRIRFVVTLGGYYHLEHMLRYATTGVHEFEGAVHRQDPDLLVKQVMAGVMYSWLEEADRRLLAAHEHQIYWGHFPADLEGRLSPAAAALYRAVANSSADGFAALLAALPAVLRERMDALSPGTSLERIRARVFLIHAVGDTYVPFTESQRLLNGLPDCTRPRLALVGFLDHALPHTLPPWELACRYAPDLLGLVALLVALLRL